MKKSTAYISTISHLTKNISDRYPDNSNHRGVNLKREAQILERAVKALHDIDARKSPTVHPDAHYKKVGIQAGLLKKKVAEATVRIQKTQREAFIENDNQIEQHLNLVENQHGQELRSVLRGMKPAERRSTILQIIKQGDSNSMAAILKASPLLSGIDGEMQDNYNDQYVKTHAPFLIESRDQMQDTVKELSIVLSSADKAADSLIDPERLQSIEDGERLANEADTAFNGSFVI